MKNILILAQRGARRAVVLSALSALLGLAGTGAAAIEAADTDHGAALSPQAQLKLDAVSSRVVLDGNRDGFHRHFGGIVRGAGGRLHLVYGKNEAHKVTAGATSFYTYSDDGGANWSAEVAVIPADAAADQRSLSLGISPSGRLLLIYARARVPAAAPTVLKLRYSDDQGASWKQGADIASIPFTYARTYGRIKTIPGAKGAASTLAFTPYFRSGSSPNKYRAALWTSADNGLSWREGAPVVDDASGQTETEMVAINPRLWFAVTRGGKGLTLYKSTSAGARWEPMGTVPLTGTDATVAPTLDKFSKNGEWFLLLGYCNRAKKRDAMMFRIASVAGAQVSANAFGSEIAIATDMVNASGYQSLVTAPDGAIRIDEPIAYVEFKEYTDAAYTQVRLVHVDLMALTSDAYLSATIAGGVVTLPDSGLYKRIAIQTEAGAANDELDTILGGREGAVLTFQGSQATNKKDVTFKSGTGNLELTQDFRAHTMNSQIVLRKSGGKWVEVSRRAGGR